MNILLVSFLKPDAPSGVRVHYLQLASELRQRGHSVDVVTPATLTGWRRHGIAALRHLLRRLGPGPRALATQVAYFLHIFWGISRRRPYDLVNAQDAGSAVAARWALGAVPVVLTGHFNAHPAEDDLRQHPHTGQAARALRRWHDFLLARTAYFISVSQYGLDLIRPYLPAGCPCRVVYNGLDLAAARAVPPANLRQRFPDRHILLNIGQLEKRKNQLLLLRAARHLRRLRADFVLGLVGKGEDEAHLRQCIIRYGLVGHVVLLGYHASALPLLHCADLYVHAATHETFGLVLVEAAAAQVPVLALAVGGVPEVLQTTPAALLSPTISPAELATELHAWLNAPGLRRTLATRQAAFAEARFGAARMVDETLAFYRYARLHFQNPVAGSPPDMPPTAQRPGLSAETMAALFYHPS